MAFGSIAGGPEAGGVAVPGAGPAAPGCWASALTGSSAASPSESMHASSWCRIIATSTREPLDVGRRRRSRNHPTLEHLVGDRRGDPVDEVHAHLGIALQELDEFLLPLRLRLATLLPELLTSRLLVLLDDLVRHHVEHRELGGRDARA